MKSTILAAVVSILALGSVAHADSDKFQGGMFTGSFSGSGFINGAQAGNWAVGAMNQSVASAAVRETKTGFKLDTQTGSKTEGFGNKFGGGVAAGGKGWGQGWGRF